jgi:hypothetical protein
MYIIAYLQEYYDNRRTTKYILGKEGICRFFLEAIINYKELQIGVCAIRILINVTLCKKKDVEKLLNYGLEEILVSLIKLNETKDNKIMHYAFRLVNNIMLCHDNLKAKLIKFQFYPILVEAKYKYSQDRKMNEEIKQCLLCFGNTNNEEILTYLYKNDYLSLLHECLAFEESLAVIIESLKVLATIMRAEYFNTECTKDMLDSLGTTDRIELLQEHGNEKVYIKAFKFLSEFFNITIN